MNSSNIEPIARDPKHYELLKREVIVEPVKQHVVGICLGNVERIEVPKIHALNFILHECLDGGGTLSLRTDARGKTHVVTLLRMDVPATYSE